MNGFVLGLYGVYLLLVGLAGNSGKLVDMIRSDAPGFLPWAVSIAVLTVMYESDTLRPIAKPFIFLLLLTFVLTNFNDLKSQTEMLYQKAGV